MQKNASRSGQTIFHPNWFFISSRLKLYQVLLFLVRTFMVICKVVFRSNSMSNLNCKIDRRHWKYHLQIWQKHFFSTETRNASDYLIWPRVHLKAPLYRFRNKKMTLAGQPVCLCFFQHSTTSTTHLNCPRIKNSEFLKCFLESGSRDSYFKFQKFFITRKKLLF